MNPQSSPYLWVKLKGKDSEKEQVLIDLRADGLYDISKSIITYFKQNTNLVSLFLVKLFIFIFHNSNLAFG
tara:strand:+ start:2129 stop:2341 length:213 start_codon:yes stop_codon:yes gene_type:complete